MPCSSTPVGPRRQAIATRWCCLPPFVTASAPTLCTVPGSITRPAHSLSSLRHRRCRRQPKTRFSAASQALPGGDWLPRRVPPQGFRALYISSSKSLMAADIQDRRWRDDNEQHLAETCLCLLLRCQDSFTSVQLKSLSDARSAGVGSSVASMIRRNSGGTRARRLRTRAARPASCG